MRSKGSQYQGHIPDSATSSRPIPSSRLKSSSRTSFSRIDTTALKKRVYPPAFHRGFQRLYTLHTSAAFPLPDVALLTCTNLETFDVDFGSSSTTQTSRRWPRLVRLNVFSRCTSGSTPTFIFTRSGILERDALEMRVDARNDGPFAPPVRACHCLA
ncbi:hypothetical protein B0H16DRAFT_1715262 [Mycena metata]|uniref:Uncharacterized protein n=1 Tax=Mycena metata TaxID=1033252 RepID=A0AAD7NQA7_9AGAR|nr:hypothetical protein B0H16DRAFT_1715262 [Mycena metata]